MRRRVFLIGLLSGCGRGSVEIARVPTAVPPPRARDAAVTGDPEPEPEPEAEPSNALAARVQVLRERWEPEGFTVLAEPPFAVLGDEGPQRVRERAEGTVRWAVTRLKAAYFARDPEQLIDVWLCGDDDSYRRIARDVFDDDPDTPYGYYSATHSALLMNIATGGGTLVHEIVHPFMAANFTACPSWFNEGLASLYEQSSERDGDIIGLTNWRLPALQQALAAGKVPPLTELLATGDQPFYDDDPGTNYAHARYLCYWLQERGRLHDFYRDFVADADTDATGETTWRRHVPDGDLARFEVAWAKFVLGLRFE